MEKLLGGMGVTKHWIHGYAPPKILQQFLWDFISSFFFIYSSINTILEELLL